MTIIIFIIVLAVLIFVHELGHFLFAKMCGIRVDAFALGFGPKIISWQGKETRYSLNIIPFGGYVKIFGENPDDLSISGPDSGRSFVNKPRWQQALVLFAGVFFNFLFAWLLYVIIFTSGVTATTDGFGKYAEKFTNPRVMITDVVKDSPAQKGGLELGDVIIAVKNGGISDCDTTKDCVEQKKVAVSGGQNENENKISSIQKVINNSGGGAISIEYSRRGLEKTAEIVPVAGIVEGKYAIGIAMQDVADLKLPFFTAIYEGFNYTIVTIKETVIGLYSFIVNIFRGSANFSDVAGPVGIAGIVGDAAELGFIYLLMITALISINLGVVNLIPFPALDGGRLLFVGVESIVRRRISPKIANAANFIGFVLLMLLLVVVTYKDIAKMF